MPVKIENRELKEENPYLFNKAVARRKGEPDRKRTTFGKAE